jgi:hypothetical protein
MVARIRRLVQWVFRTFATLLERLASVGFVYTGIVLAAQTLMALQRVYELSWGLPQLGFRGSLRGVVWLLGFAAYLGVLGLTLHYLRGGVPASALKVAVTTVGAVGLRRSWPCPRERFATTSPPVSGRPERGPGPRRSASPTSTAGSSPDCCAPRADDVVNGSVDVFRRGQPHGQRAAGESAALVEGFADGVEGLVRLVPKPSRRCGVVACVLGQLGVALPRCRIVPVRHDRAAAAPGLDQAGGLQSRVCAGDRTGREPQVAGELAYRGQPGTGGKCPGLDQVRDLLTYLLVRRGTGPGRDRDLRAGRVRHQFSSIVDHRGSPVGARP